MPLPIKILAVIISLATLFCWSILTLTAPRVQTDNPHARNIENASNLFGALYYPTLLILIVIVIVFAWSWIQ